MTKRKRILFFAHAVTMAHFARPLKWIEGLDVELFDIYLASHPKFENLSKKVDVTFLEINCIDSAKFEKIVVNAESIYDAGTFEEHIDEDIRLIEKIKPDFVVGDFRHSLTVSCRIKKIKYINLTNAYWSPEIKLRFPLPEAPIVRILGEALAQILIGIFLPLALKISFFKMAFALRKSFKRVNLKFTDYRQVITDGDLTLYCDTPELIPLKKQRSHERFVGPLIWSMSVKVPEWWGNLDPDKKRIFITLGSSGHAHSLPMIIKALGKLDVQIVMALAGKRPKIPAMHNVFVTDFLPIEAACQDADLVICNGGSPLVHSALSYGVPTIGIVCNNDQLLNMAHIQERGAGLLLRYWSLNDKKLMAAVNEILYNPHYRTQSKKIQAEFSAINLRERLQNAIEGF
jgi:UDP:flavonoid glycosyltransferase YjiC (YdhE family)